MAYKETLSIGLASEHNEIAGPISKGETWYIYLVQTDGKTVPENLLIKEIYSIHLTDSNTELRNRKLWYDITQSYVRTDSITKLVVTSEASSATYDVYLGMTNTSDEVIYVYTEQNYGENGEGYFTPSMLGNYEINGNFIPMIKNNKNFIPQLLSSDSGISAPGLHLSFKMNGSVYFIPFTDNSDYMIGPRLKHNGTVYAPKGDFVLIFSWQGSTQYLVYGVKSDYSVVMIMTYTTYMNFDVWLNFKPKFYYSQDSGLYLCMYGEGDNLHFGILKQDASITDSTFSGYGDFTPFADTGYFFYDTDASKYKICFLGGHWTYKKGDQFAMGVFSFSIENNVCKNFSFSETILNTTYYDYKIYVNLTSNGGNMQIRKCKLSNGKNGYYYYGIWTGVNYNRGSTTDYPNDCRCLIPTTGTGGASIASDISPSFKGLIDFSDEILKKFAYQYGSSFSTDTSRLFYNPEKNSLIGFLNTSNFIENEKRVTRTDTNGKEYTESDLISYNLDTGVVTLIYKKPTGDTTSGFSRVVGVGKLY